MRHIIRRKRVLLACILAVSGISLRQRQILQKTIRWKVWMSLICKEFLQPYLDIQDPKTSKRIRYVGGIRGLSELERMVDHVKETQQKDAVAFSMYPTSMAELFAVADAGMLMPPKSTWFEPKLRSGLFLHML